MDTVMVNDVSYEMTDNNRDWLFYMGAIQKRVDEEGSYERTPHHHFIAIEVSVLMNLSEDVPLTQYVSATV